MVLWLGLGVFLGIWDIWWLWYLTFGLSRFGLFWACELGEWATLTSFEVFGHVGCVYC